METSRSENILLIIFITLLIASLGLGGYRYWLLQSENAALVKRVGELEQSLGTTKADLKRTENEKIGLANDLNALQVRLGILDEQVDIFSDTVGTLEKLSKTDPELLQKYSKVFFLNEHYVPQRLTAITPKYLYDESTEQHIHSDVWKHLKALLDDVEDDGVTLWINSAYRSFGTQSSLKSTYKITYGSGANSFSADQGYSEHQLGTTVDFTTSGIGGGFEGFEDTDAYAWLLENAHRYGFVLSYPEDNAYYVFEPWHWRFVGAELARDLHRDGRNFYDLDQREIDEHLVNIFD